MIRSLLFTRFGAVLTGIAMILLVSLPFTATALVSKSGSSVIVTEQDGSGDAYIAGGRTQVSAPIEGDAYIAGGTVIITDTVSEDAVIVGGDVSIDADIGDDLRVLAGAVTTNGAVGGDVLIAGGEVIISSTRIGGSLYALGDDLLEISADVAADTKLLSESATVSGVFNGDVDAYVSELIVAEGTEIKGTLNTLADTKVTLEGAAAIANQESTLSMKDARHSGGSGFPTGRAVLIGLAIALVTMVVTALIIGLGAKKITTHVVQRCYEGFGKSLLAGFVIVFGMPIAILIAFVTGILWPLGLIGMFAYGAIIGLGVIFGSIALGAGIVRLIDTGSDTYKIDWLSIVIGSIVFVLLHGIPVLGWIVLFALLLVGVGAMYRFKIDMYKKLK